MSKPERLREWPFWIVPEGTGSGARFFMSPERRLWVRGVWEGGG